MVAVPPFCDLNTESVNNRKMALFLYFLGKYFAEVSKAVETVLHRNALLLPSLFAFISYVLRKGFCFLICWKITFMCFLSGLYKKQSKIRVSRSCLHLFMAIELGGFEKPFINK